jgi:homospermidine synthase
MSDDKNDAGRAKVPARKPAARRKAAAVKPAASSATKEKATTTTRMAAKTRAAAKPAVRPASRKAPAKAAAARPAAAKAPAKTAAAKPAATKAPAKAAAKAAVAKPAAAKAPAKSAAKPATPKPATAKAAPAPKAAAKPASKNTPSKPAAPKPAAPKTAAAKPAAAKAAPARKPATRRAPAKKAAPKPSWPKHGKITGPVVVIGYGSIGKGTLPLIERHFDFDPKRLTVIDPVDTDAKMVTDNGYKFEKVALTPDNYIEVLTSLLGEGDGQGFCVNLSVDTSSLDLMKLCRNLGALYIDTVVEPWAGFYFDDKAGMADRTNYALRETVRREKKKNPGGTTAVSCCGANPGMVSWFVKKALVDIANDTGVKFNEPSSRKDWAKLMKKVGVKGIHIAERDTQVARKPKPQNAFWNTWSVEGFIAEGFQPAELGWGTHEKWKPANAKRHKKGCDAAIYLEQPGANTRVRTWCPTPGAQYGYLVTHNESISIADYFTLKKDKKLSYRPTCHYAYHPANEAVLSLHEMFGAAGKVQAEQHVLTEDEIATGIDELGVLLYGHDKNAYWYGSQLSVEETRKLAPYQNATGLQVSSAVIAGMVWALENPEAGIVETDEMDYKRCLEIQTPYLGPVKGYYTDWTPLSGRPGFFPDDIDKKDPWQFKNVLVR